MPAAISAQPANIVWVTTSSTQTEREPTTARATQTVRRGLLVETEVQTMYSGELIYPTIRPLRRNLQTQTEEEMFSGKIVCIETNR